MGHRLVIRAARIGFLGGILAAAAQAQSIAASLSAYENILKVTSVSGVSARSFSGAAWHPETKCLYVVDNDNADVYELSTAGALLRTIDTTGVTDPEGLVYQGEDYFLLAEEGLADVVRLKLPRTGTGPVAKSGGTTLNLGPHMANSGLEGVAYCAANRTAYAVKEIDPPRMYRIALDAAGNPVSSAPDAPFDIGSKAGDAADIFALEDGNFIVVNQEQDKLEGYGPQGQALSSLSLGMSKPEGLAIDPVSGLLYVVGEPSELFVFRKKGTGVRIAPPRGPKAAGFRSSLGPVLLFIPRIPPEGGVTGYAFDVGGALRAAASP